MFFKIKVQATDFITNKFYYRNEVLVALCTSPNEFKTRFSIVQYTALFNRITLLKKSSSLFVD